MLEHFDDIAMTRDPASIAHVVSLAGESFYSICKKYDIVSLDAMCGTFCGCALIGEDLLVRTLCAAQDLSSVVVQFEQITLRFRIAVDYSNVTTAVRVCLLIFTSKVIGQRVPRFVVFGEAAKGAASALRLGAGKVVSISDRAVSCIPADLWNNERHSSWLNCHCKVDGS